MSGAIGFFASIGVLFKEIFDPAMPGPVRNEVQRLFGQAIGQTLRNRRLVDAINLRAEQNERRRKLKEEEMGYEAVMAHAVAREKMNSAVEGTKRSQERRESRAKDLRLAEERQLASATTPEAKKATVDAITAARTRFTDRKSQDLLDQLLTLAEKGFKVTIDSTGDEIVVTVARPEKIKK